MYKKLIFVFLMVLTLSAMAAEVLPNGIIVDSMMKFSWSDPDANKPLELFVEDLETLSRLQFNKPTKFYRKYFGSKPDAPYRYVLKNLRRIGWINSESDGQGVTIAIGDKSSGSIKLSAAYMKLPLAMRLSGIIHEARHLFNSDQLHEICPSPYVFKMSPGPNGEESFAYTVFPIKAPDTPACNSSEDSAYGVQFGFLQAILLSCTNCPDQLKQEAEAGKWRVLYRITDPEAAYRLWKQSNSF